MQMLAVLIQILGGRGVRVVVGWVGVAIPLIIDLNKVWHSLPSGSWGFSSSARWRTLLKITCSLIWFHAHRQPFYNWLPIQIFYMEKVCHPPDKKHSRPCASNVYHCILNCWLSSLCFSSFLIWLKWVSLRQSDNSR